MVEDKDRERIGDIKGEIRFRDGVKSKYLIVDEGFSVIFTGDDYITVESCEGCMIHSTEHFQLLWGEFTTGGEESLLLLKERKS